MPELNNQQQQNDSNSIGTSLPGSVYASRIHPETTQDVIRDVISQKEAFEKPEYIALEGSLYNKENSKERTIYNVVDKLQERHGQDIGNPSYDYVGLIANSVYDHPERSIEQHASSLRPTAEEQRHWEPFAKIAQPETEMEKYTWKAETGSIQTYQNMETGKHIHIDGDTGQFYDQKRNPISEYKAIEHATSHDGRGRLLDNNGDELRHNSASWTSFQAEEEQRSVPLLRATDSWSGLAFAAREAGIENPISDFNFTYSAHRDGVFTYKRDTGEELHFQDHNKYAQRSVSGEGPAYEVSYYADPNGNTKISPAEALQRIASSELKAVSMQETQQEKGLSI